MNFNPHSSVRAVLAALLVLCSVHAPAHAARISEPNTVLYGRIVERVGERDFPITRGQLVWNLRTTGAGGREYQLTAKLESLASGRYSYRLSIPHEVLAYDLSVKPGAIGLASVAGSIQHGSITLDGRALEILPGAVDGLTLDQKHRAGAVRVDLMLVLHSTDTDGDGIPDWYEDQNGMDKYDSSDASRFTQDQQTASDSDKAGTAARAQTFAEWRTAWFPGNTSDLDAFGQEDPDRDGVPNLLEYAFGLNPTVADGNTAGALPRAMIAGGRAGVSFHKRGGATDLNYAIESSDDLFQWRDASQQLEEAASASPGAGGASAYVEREDSTQTSHRFYRVRVNRR